MRHLYSKSRLSLPLASMDLCAPVYIVEDQTEADYFERSGGQPEAPLIEWAAQFLDARSSFVDVGAHVGTWSLSYAPRCRHVHAFEPQLATFNALCGGIALNRLDDRISARRCALSRDNCAAELRIINQDGGGSSLIAVPGSTQPIRREKVEARTLDSFELTDVGFIKMDVEGAERDVLAGAETTLRRSGFPPILFEAWNHDWYAASKQALFEAFDALGYRIVPITGWPEMWLAEQARVLR